MLKYRLLGISKAASLCVTLPGVLSAECTAAAIASYLFTEINGLQYWYTICTGLSPSDGVIQSI